MSNSTHTASTATVDQQIQIQWAAPFHRIMVAIDGSHTGARALKTAAQMAELFGAKLAVVHVVDTFAGWAPECAWGSHPHPSQDQERGQKLLTLLTDKLPAALEVDRILKMGDPGSEIAAAAIAWQADLVVLGGPSHKRLGRLLVGSVDEQVLDQCHCTVMLIGPEQVPSN
jgi:nucleotide-binding universal stress UspA family protein